MTVKKSCRPAPPADAGIEHVATRRNLYPLLASIEEVFRLPELGYASTDQDRFGLDVCNSGRQD